MDDFLWESEVHDFVEALLLLELLDEMKLDPDEREEQELHGACYDYVGIILLSGIIVYCTELVLKEIKSLKDELKDKNENR